jgi:hypothetical protein
MSYARSMRALPSASLVVAAVMVASCSTPPRQTAPRAPARSYAVVDAMGPFWTFWDRYKDAQPDEQVKGFQAVVVAANPELFGPTVVGLGGTEPAWEARLKAYLETLPGRVDAMRRLSGQMQDDLQRHDETFRRAVPDMAWTGTVYFTVSVDAFDGAVRQVNGKDALLFGLDKVARLHGADANLAALFHHELFHVHHAMKMACAPEPPEGPHGLLLPLWTEGLAVRFSKALNPQASWKQLLLDDGMVERGNAMLPQLARDLRAALLDTTEQNYVDYFRGAGARTDIPKRVGYYVGYRVADELAQTRNLQELTTLCGAELLAAVDGVLAGFEQR